MSGTWVVLRKKQGEANWQELSRDSSDDPNQWLWNTDLALRFAEGIAKLRVGTLERRAKGYIYDYQDRPTSVS